MEVSELHDEVYADVLAASERVSHVWVSQLDKTILQFLEQQLPQKEL